MSKTRLEAFSDGVIAILITILVLELKIPHADTLEGLRPMLPVLASYVMSFVYLGIYWNNHHHLLHTVDHVNGRILWTNLHLLFWLSLVPFATAWMGENHFSYAPTAVYGGVRRMAALAFTLLVRTIVASQGARSSLRAAVGRDRKGKISLVLYSVAIGATYFDRWISIGLYVLVAMIWFIPDSRIESRFKD